MPYIKQFLDERRSCVSHYIGCPGSGKSAVIDPSDNISQYVDQAAREFTEITHIIDTHIHADHVSGARALSKVTGAPVYMHESTDALFEFLRVKEGDVIDVGNVSLKVLFTPGHTKESLSLLYIDRKRSDKPWGIFSGDTLFVGDIGRLDLTGAGTTEQMYDSLFSKIMGLDDYVEIYPAHYVGSVCGTGMSLKTFSTIGFERRFNPAISSGRSFKDFERFLETNRAPPFPQHEKIKKINMGYEKQMMIEARS